MGLIVKVLGPWSSLEGTRCYQVIYTRLDQGEVVVVGVQEVNKHEY